MISYTGFFVIYSVSMVVALVLAVRFMVGRVWGNMRPVATFVKQHYAYLIVLAAFPLMVQWISMIKSALYDGHAISHSVSNGAMLFSMGGNIITGLQSNIESDLASGYFMFLYMWVFAFFTYFLPILLVAKRDKKTLIAFTIAVATNYIVLISFYLTFPAAVSSNLPTADVKPVLYSSAYWGSMASSVDCLTNCFPSGHVSLSFTSLFVIWLAGREYRPLAYALAGAAVSIAIAVLYLGIHYPLDVVGGLLLAVGSTALARSDWVRAAIARYVRTLRVARPDES